MKVKAAAASLAILTLTSCSQGFEILLNVADRSISFRDTSWMVFSKQIEPCLSQISVYSHPQTDLLWQLNADNETCQKVRTIKLDGEHPGFQQKGQAPRSGSIKISALAEGRHGFSDTYQLR
jgi:hypothetical protein